MAPVVLVERTLLRRGALDVLLDFVKGIDSALSLVEQRQPRVHLAHRNYARARAIGDLLDAIGWTSTDTPTCYRLDVKEHAWAATNALTRLIARQRAAVQMAESEDEAEAVGEAAAALLQAENDLVLIEKACRDANLAITSPSPARPHADEGPARE